MFFEQPIVPIGICVPTCAPFGSDCPSGYDCATVLEDLIDVLPGSRVANLSYSCRTAGTVALGAPCPNGDSDCVADAVCFDPALGPTSGGGGVCTAICDGAHSCPTGRACSLSVTIAGAPQPSEFNFGISGGGWCL